MKISLLLNKQVAGEEGAEYVRQWARKVGYGQHIKFDYKGCEKVVKNDLANVSIGKAVAIGKIRLSSEGTSKNILPIFHFIVLEENGSYYGVCLELRTEGYGKEIKNCAEDIKDRAFEFVQGVFRQAKNSMEAYESIYAYEEIDEWGVEWWNAYRRLQLFIASKGERFDLYTILQNEITGLKKRIDDLESAQKVISIEKGRNVFQAEVFDLEEIA
jgi:hypothetical protein